MTDQASQIRLYPTMAEWDAPDPMRLPENFTTRGDLTLRGTQIAALPDGLTVGGDLTLDCGTFNSVGGKRAGWCG